MGQFVNVLPPPVRMQRIDAHGSIEVRADRGATRLAGLYQESSAKIRMPSGSDDALEAILINTAGGMTGGDRLSWHGRAGPNARLTLTTQACEKVYRSSGGQARVEVGLEAGAGSYLAWLPQETILFDDSAFFRDMTVDLAADARCLLVESLILGRAEMGEVVDNTDFRDRWRVSVDGRIVHAEELHISGNAARALARRATGGGAGAMASLLLIGDDVHDRLEAVRGLLGRHSLIAAGVSAWNVGATGKLLARMLAKDGYHLRKALQPLIELLNGKAGLPRIWSV
jgi:urease accessory protein